MNISNGLIPFFEYRSKDPTSYKQSHSDVSYKILVLHKGKMHVTLKDIIYQLQPNDIVVFNSNSSGLSELTELNELLEHSMLQIAPDYINTYGQYYKFSAAMSILKRLHNVIIRTDNKVLLKQINDNLNEINQLIKEMDENKENYSIRECLFHRLVLRTIGFMFLLIQTGDDRSTKIITLPKIDNIYVNDIIEYIEKNFTNPELQVRQLSCDLYIDKYYASKLFRTYTGNTIKNYIIQRRLKRSKYLLQFDKNKTITNIAYESGFSNISHFCRLFKENYGVAPSKFKQEILGIE